MAKLIDLTGQQFGALVVISRAPNSSDGSAIWNVRCSCGKEFSAIGGNLRSGKTTSCGHTRFEKRQISIAGERFGKLVAIERIGSKSHNSIWRCRCDCGNTADVAMGNLRSGHTTSCGCAKKEAQNDPTARVKALKESPNTGMYETNRSAKSYIISKNEIRYEFRNLRNFVREHTELFEIGSSDTDMRRVASRISSAARTGTKYKGWTVVCKDSSPKKELSEAHKEHMKSLQKAGLEAAMSVPENQRGPQNRTSKIWVLIDPSGKHVPVLNLLDWCRENYTLFEPPCDDVDKAARRVASGFRCIASSMRGVPSRQRPVSSYKGWGLAKIPIKKEDKK